jgi:glycosyltransferase involved in cell wall biosynthesis
VDRPLTVAWFVPVKHRDFNRMPASVWNRCLQMLPYLERLGVRCLVNDRKTRADVAAFVRWQDHAAAEVAREAKARGTRVVFDLCVNYFDVTGLRHDGSGATAERRAECLAMTALADAITTASPFIAERARAHHPRVAYFPDSIDRAHFRERKTYPARWEQPPTAIWCGYGVKAWCLDAILPALARHRMPLTVIANERPASWRTMKQALHQVEYVRWRYETLPKDLLWGDVCVSPRDFEGDFRSYDLGHSCFKIGIFLAEGVPALASRVPSYSEVLHQDKTGLFCESAADWDAAFDRVAEGPQTLAEWGAAAADVMRPHWSENVAAGYAKLFQELVDG